MFKTFTSVIVAVLIHMAVLMAGPTVKLKVNHPVSMAPTIIRFTVTIPPFAGNRKACLAYDGGEASLTCWQVDGENHPTTKSIERKIGSAGEYFATVTLVSIVNDEVKHTTDTTQFIVTEPGVPFVR